MNYVKQLYNKMSTNNNTFQESVRESCYLVALEEVSAEQSQQTFVSLISAREQRSHCHRYPSYEHQLCVRCLSPTA